MVVGGNSLASDVVITVEPVREEARTSSSADIRAAVSNHGSGLRGWIIEEGLWAFAQFVKVSLSVFVLRGVTKLFQTGAASQQAYTRAERLWQHGYRESGYRVGGGPRWRAASNAGTRSSYGPTGATSGNGFDGSGRQASATNPRYVASVGSYHLYLHESVLDPARQWWPCPILLRSACESCSFLEYDRGGAPRCVAVLKLRTILDGVDGGDNFDEIRQWIRNS